MAEVGSLLARAKLAIKLSSGAYFVAFPNRKSIIFDNKLDFSDRKIAIGQGFRYSNFKVVSK